MRPDGMRSTHRVLATAAATVLTALVAVPARGEAVVYETQDVKAEKPGEFLAYAAIDIPTGYTRDRVSWHQVAWIENVRDGRTISLDLHPDHETVEELAAERAALATQPGYVEHAYVVNTPDDRVTARWVYALPDARPGKPTRFVSVVLLRTNRFEMNGRLDEKPFVQRIRRHIVRHLVFPS
jgi:hypothetical protein